MSLRTNLNQIIKDRNGEIVSVNEIEAYCNKAHYKKSNAERRLRPSESPDIERVWNDKKTAIIGYKYKTGLNQYTVPSKTVPNQNYSVTDLTTAWTCNCLGYRYTGQCHHIKYIKKVMG